MKPKQIVVDIQNACNEDWGGMQPVHGGRHCFACAKNVVDFTGMTKAEMAKYLSDNPGNICGRVKVDYLNTPLVVEQEKQGGRLYAWLLRAAVLTGIALPMTANAEDGKPTTSVLAPADKQEQPTDTVPANSIYGVVAGRNYGTDINRPDYTGYKNNRIEVEGYPNLFTTVKDDGTYVLELPADLVGCNIVLMRKIPNTTRTDTRTVIVQHKAQQVDFIDYYETKYDKPINDVVVSVDIIKGNLIPVTATKKSSRIKRIFSKKD